MEEDKLLPIGTPVFDIRFGWGEVKENTNTQNSYPLVCTFKGQGRMSYKKEGRSVADHKSPILSLTDYTLEEGGFTSVTEFDFDAPKVGDWGYFWDREDRNSCVFGKLGNLDKSLDYPYLLDLGGINYRHFSKEIPEHIKKLQNEKD